MPISKRRPNHDSIKTAYTPSSMFSVNQFNWDVLNVLLTRTCQFRSQYENQVVDTPLQNKVLYTHHVRQSVPSTYSLDSDTFICVWQSLGGDVITYSSGREVLQHTHLVLIQSSDVIDAILFDLFHHPVLVLHDDVIPRAVVVVIELLRTVSNSVRTVCIVGGQLRDDRLIHTVMLLLDNWSQPFTYVCEWKEGEEQLPEGIRQQITHEVEYFTHSEEEEESRVGDSAVINVDPHMTLEPLTECSTIASLLTWLLKV